MIISLRLALSSVSIRMKMRVDKYAHTSYPDTVLHMSSLTTCQALIILAYREFGLGIAS